VKREMVKGLGDWEQRLNTALVKSAPAGLVLAEPRPPVPPAPMPLDDEPPVVVRKTARDR